MDEAILMLNNVHSFVFIATRFHANFKAQYQLVSSSNHSFQPSHSLMRSLPPCSTAPSPSFHFAFSFLLPTPSPSFLQLTSLLITVSSRPFILLFGAQLQSYVHTGNIANTRCGQLLYVVFAQIMSHSPLHSAKYSFAARRSRISRGWGASHAYQKRPKRHWMGGLKAAGQSAGDPADEKKRATTFFHRSACVLRWYTQSPPNCLPGSSCLPLDYKASSRLTVSRSTS